MASERKRGPRQLGRMKDGRQRVLQWVDEGGDLPLDNVTLEELADFLDGDAENNNAHRFCGVHRALAAVLTVRMGEDAALQVLTHVAGFSGLHGMMDDAGSAGDYQDAFEALGVPKPWRDWTLPTSDPQRCACGHGRAEHGSGDGAGPCRACRSGLCERFGS